MTIEMCLSVCREKGFRYAGLQWQIECYCGNEPANGFKWSWLSKCDDRCAGNSNQICGGSNAMSVYSTPGIHLNGQCIYDYPSPRRVLGESSKTGQKNLTITECKSICKGSSFQIKLKIVYMIMPSYTYTSFILNGSKKKQTSKE